MHTSCWAFNSSANSSCESSAFIGGVFTRLTLTGALCTPTSRFNPTTFFSAQKHPKLILNPQRKTAFMILLFNKDDNKWPWIRTGSVDTWSSWMILTLGLLVLELLRLWLEGKFMSGVDLLDTSLKDIEFRVLDDKHSIGTSPDKGLQMYFSASFHFEFNSTPSGFNQSWFFLYVVLACNAIRKIKEQNRTNKRSLYACSLFFSFTTR